MPEPKDKWDKARVILEPVGGLLTALAVTGFGLLVSSVLSKQQALDSNNRLYSELMSKREESESTLRKEMFNSIIGSFLSHDSGSIETKVLNLELLAYNFHASLNLKPLFLHLVNQIQDTKGLSERERRNFLNRLYRVARDVAEKERLSLGESGQQFDRSIELDSLLQNSGMIELPDGNLQISEVTRNYKITVLDADTATKYLQVRLDVQEVPDSTQPHSDHNAATESVTFWVGFFDFPMIDNTRLSHNERCSIVLTNFEGTDARISVIVFPGSHASLSDKPYFEDVLHSLQEHRSE